MNTISNKLLSVIAYATDAGVVWVDLKGWFDKVDRSKGYHLHREICKIHQDFECFCIFF